MSISRNLGLLELCGFDIFKQEHAIPKAWDYTRFLQKLIKHQKEIEKLFNNLCNMVKDILPDFGENLAIDGKSLKSKASGKPKEKLPPDGRRDTTADWGKKEYRGKNKDGSLWKKVSSWFGYTLHLIVDTKYELPVAFTIKKASVAEQPVAQDLLNKMEKYKREILNRCKYFSADRGYDDTKLITRLYDDFGIKPIIDIRNAWKTNEETRIVDGFENVVQNYKGNIYCYCPKEFKERQMSYGGFEKDRGTHKYICPAKAYGISCKGSSKCNIKSFVRINLGIDRRVFTPVARSSYKWKRLFTIKPKFLFIIARNNKRGLIV